MKQPRIVMIASDTARARAYANAIIRANLGPIGAVFYGQAAPSDVHKRSYEDDMIGDLWIPNVSRPVREIYIEAGWPFIEADTDSINADEMLAAIQTIQPDLAVFAGKGGEIVSSKILSSGVKFLHVHPGALPEQRGSTTMYYSFLDKSVCAVSAILLAPEIDNGPVVAQASYPLPPSDIDTDLLYDNAIRSDLLAKTLRDYLVQGKFTPLTQDETTAQTYYVIHPVLKHLAILSLSTDRFTK